MLQQTIDKLSYLHLAGFIDALREQTQSSQYIALSFEERLAFLVDTECLRREDRRLSKSLKDAKLGQHSTIEDIDFNPSRGLNRAQILEIAQATWVKNHHNLIITGPTGAGKSFFACALANRVCKLKLRAIYFKAADLLRQLSLAKADGSYHKLAAKLARHHLLIIDEWLRDTLSQEHAREILDLIDNRFRKASTIFVSQLPVTDWHQHISDPTLADAILDRIVHDSLRTDLSGDSMRKRTSKIKGGESSLRSD